MKSDLQITKENKITDLAEILTKERTIKKKKMKLSK